MDFLTSMKISSSGLNVQRKLMETVSSNLANIETTRTPEGGPYRRKELVVTALPVVKIINYKKSQAIFKQLDVAGTCIVRGLFSNSDCRNIAQKLELLGLGSGPHLINPDREQHLTAQTADFLAKLQHLERIQYLRNVKSVSRFLRSIMKNKNVLAILSQYFKSPITILNSQYIFKKNGTMYGDQNFVPHQDAITYKPSNESLVSCQLSITGMKKNRGGLFVFPGSHKYGLFKAEQTYDFSKQTKGVVKNVQNECEVPSYLKRFYPETLPGDLIFLRGHCVHGSDRNKEKGTDRQIFAWMTARRDTKFLRGRYADPRPLI